MCCNKVQAFSIAAKLLLFSLLDQDTWILRDVYVWRQTASRKQGILSGKQNSSRNWFLTREQNDRYPLVSKRLKTQPADWSLDSNNWIMIFHHFLNTVPRLDLCLFLSCKIVQVWELVTIYCISFWPSRAQLKFWIGYMKKVII